MSNLIGSKLNQVPTNSDLGDLAFQNAASLKQITARAVTGKDMYLNTLAGSAPALNLNFYSLDLVRNNYMDSLVTFQRNSIATVWKYDANNRPVLATVAADVPRYEIDPVTGELKGLLIEESRTNLLPTSSISAFSTGQNSNTAVASGIVAPDGTSTNVWKMTPNTVNSVHSVYYPHGVTSNAVRTVSGYFKGAGYNYIRLYCDGGTVNMGYVLYTLSGNGSASTTGAGTPLAGLVSYGIQNVGNGWYRCWLTGTLDAGTCYYHIDVCNNTPAYSYVGDDTNGVYGWGMQSELGSFPTSYITTTGATVTRQADFISFPTSSFYSSSGGTLVLDATTGPSVVSRTFVALNNASATEQIGIRFTSTGATQMFNDTASATTGDPGTGTKGALPSVSPYTRFKAAFAFAANDFRGSVNGTSVRSDTSGALATGITTMNIGSRNNSTTENCFGYVGSIQYYTAKFSDAILQELSA